MAEWGRRIARAPARDAGAEQEPADGVDDRAERIRKAVERRTRRDSDPADPSGGGVPRPRLALRVGVVGHRPERLKASLDKLNGLPVRKHDPKLDYPTYIGRLETALHGLFGDIDAALVHERDALTLPGEDGVARPVHDNRVVPLVRLVCGAALGADLMAAGVVDRRLRGPRPGDDATVEELVAPRAGPKGVGCEWRIDMILPCRQANFALAAHGDLKAERALAGLAHDAQLDPAALREPTPDEAVAFWNEAFGRADTLLTLPPLWRRRDPGAPASKAVSNTDADAPAEPPPCRPAILEAFSGIDHPNDCWETHHQYELDYVRSGEFLLRQVDLLIALWDGKGANGPGGTIDIITKADEAGIPVVVLATDNFETPARMIEDVERAGSPSNLVQPPAPSVRARVDAANARKGQMQRAIRAIIAPPADHGQGSSHGPSRTSPARELSRFLDERWPRDAGPRTYDAFLDFWGGAGKRLRALFDIVRGAVSPLPTDHRSEANWTAFINAQPDEGLQGVRLKRVLHRRHVVTSLLAERYGALYRDAFIRSYLAAALAVLLALAGLALIPAGPAAPVWKSALLGLEFLVVFWIAGWVKRARRECWQERFIAYSALAETLRHLRFLATFAEFRQAGRLEDPAPTWWLWYLQATAREIGLPHGHLGATYQADLIESIRTWELNDQLAHHSKEADRLHHAGHGLHRLGDWMFRIVLAVLGLGALTLGGSLAVAAVNAGSVLPAAVGAAFKSGLPWLYQLYDASKVWIGLAAAFLPVLGATLASIRFHADLEGAAARAQLTRTRIADLFDRAAAAAAAKDFETTRRLLGDIVAVQARDVQSFMALYQRRAVTLPG